MLLHGFVDADAATLRKVMIISWLFLLHEKPHQVSLARMAFEMWDSGGPRTEGA